MQQVRQAELPLIELRLHAGELRVRGRGRLRERFAARDQRRDVLAPPFRHADGLGVGIALRAQAVHVDLRLLALLLEHAERGDVERESAPREVARDGFRIGSGEAWDRSRQYCRASAMPSIVPPMQSPTLNSTFSAARP